jgi:gamma-glutamyltranspeptidase/glutathione hydrolase
MSLIRSFDLGMDAGSAVSAPRWLVGGMELGGTERTLVAESSIPSSTRGALEAAGYAVETVVALDESVGHGQLIRVRDDGAFEAGSDPRADGGVAVR